MQNPLHISAIIQATPETVWEYWNNPEHIKNWAFASDDWEAPAAINDIRVNGTFKTTMAAKDGSARFDFEGVYTNIIPHQVIEYVMPDGREVTINFSKKPEGTEINESFNPENINSLEMQQQGWQSILNNFKKYVESQTQ
ncbi:SRPBCC domain-containing protein [Candidatus Uhrbacteria bacterium]|nr:SRPBCC domain-containing protein [Candidatus Uhrbacteria bacterium]